MEKKIKKIVKLIANKFQYKHVNITCHFSYIEDYVWEEIIFKDAINTIRANNLDELIEQLVEMNCITKEELLPKKREQKEHIINRGKLE